MRVPLTLRDGGPAFPRPHSWDESAASGMHEGDRAEPHGAQSGMTLRDYFAGQSLAGMMANADWLRAVDGRLDTTKGRMRDVIARAAYEAAEAMLTERAKW